LSAKWHHWRVLEPTTVWAARLGSPDEGIKGYLVLETEHLSFTSDLSDLEIRIPLADIRHVRRIFGSPVMVVEHGGSVVAFYFAQPPPVIGAKAPFDERRQRSRSVTYLGDTNASKRKDIKRWVQGIRAAVKGAC
jgi:hypothetical protein